ncbi:MAG TPA: HAD family phosphatase [Methanomassiliicoccales archaeon]|jgi:phosphoserine phosphatase
MYKLFLFDMDGVLLQHKSSWGYCQEAIGCDLRHFYDEFGQEARDGKDLIELVMRKMAKHGLTEEKLMELARKAPQTKGVEKVLKTIHANGGVVMIISGGIGAFAHELSDQYPMTSFVCNELHYVGNDPVPTCEIKVGHEDKGKVARRMMASMGVSKEETVAIGDYSNDCAMFAEAGLSIAFNGDEEAKAAATESIDSDDLSDILPIIYGNNGQKIVNGC